MAHKAGYLTHPKSIQQLTDDGFEIYSDSELADINEAKRVAQAVAPAPPVGVSATNQIAPTPQNKPPEPKVVIVDNKDMVSSMKESNQNIAALIAMLQNKPTDFTLDIVRNAQGRMTGVKVRVNRS